MHRRARRVPPVKLRLALVLTAAVAATGPASLSAQSDEEAVRATLIAMWDAIENEDMERYATYIHDDFTSFGETDTYLNEGKAQEMAGVRGWTSRSANIRTEMHQPDVTVRGDVAWITYYWTDEATSKISGERETSRGKSTRIFVREGGRWLCIHGHYTLVE